MNEYDAYMQKCEAEKQKNEKYLKAFENALREKNLSDKTIRRHLFNADFYINEFLFKYEVLPMREGIYELSDFLGYYFIRKCMWSTPASVKSTATSLKKFYQVMAQNGFISREDYQSVVDDIKENLADWVEECRAFNEPDDDFYGAW